MPGLWKKLDSLAENLCDPDYYTEKEVMDVANAGYDLSRFHKAQARDYKTALSEIRSGRKRSHWMWYIFPQIKGLGHSDMADYYGISNLEEAKDYLADPILKERLTEISSALLALDSRDAKAVMGVPDNLKLRSCMTLFAIADPDEEVFQKVLDKFYGR